jgi:hypothetical protein
MSGKLKHCTTACLDSLISSLHSIGASGFRKGAICNTTRLLGIELKWLVSRNYDLSAFRCLFDRSPCPIHVLFIKADLLSQAPSWSVLLTATLHWTNFASGRQCDIANYHALGSWVQELMTELGPEPFVRSRRTIGEIGWGWGC